MLERTERQLAIEDLVTEDAAYFAVDPRVYTDPAIFATEMRRIFWRTWVYVAHESEIPNPGDFRTSAMGLTPVLVTRGRQFGLGQERTIAGRCEYRLRYADGWRIVLKKVVLPNRYLPLENFTFII